MFNYAADFFGSIFIPMFKVAGIVFVMIAIVLGAVIAWQRMRERREYAIYQWNYQRKMQSHSGSERAEPPGPEWD